MRTGSSQPVVLIHGYDYDTFAADLNALLDHLGLDDVILVGFSMGTGEVTPLPGQLRLRTGARGRAVRRDPTVAAEDRRHLEGVDATYVCVDSWLTDYRGDLPKIDVPMLVVHGTGDRILPFPATAERLPGMVANLQLVRVKGGPHNIGRTHPDEVNKALLDFLAAR